VAGCIRLRCKYISYHIIDRQGDREGVHNKKRSQASEGRRPSPASPSSKEALRAHWQLVSKTWLDKDITERHASSRTASLQTAKHGLSIWRW